MILDADGLDALAARQPPERFRALMAEAWQRGRDVAVPAVVCAEGCRGVARTRAVESAMARHRVSSAQRPAVRVIDTDFNLARQVGAVLYGAEAPSSDMVDAHVVAVAASHGGGLVVSADPDAIARLAAAVPAARIVVRPAR